MFDEEIEELIPLTAQWSPVQAYYAVYLGLRALVVAVRSNNAQRSHGHLALRE